MGVLGDEPAEAHRERLLASLRALRVECWPYAGAVGLVERDGDLVQVHAIRNWCCLGSAPTVAGARRLSAVAAGFDADGYRILVGPVLTGALEVLTL